MPELPEVETIAQVIAQPGSPACFFKSMALNNRPGMVGRMISDVVVLWNRSIQEPDVLSFKQLLSGQEIRSVDRRGKFLVVELST